MPTEAENAIWPEWLLPTVKWIVANNVADVLDVAGILITVFGFLFTIMQLLKSRRAAEAARDAANQARQSLSYAAAISDFASAVEILEEIKRLHRNRVVQPLPDRYMALRKILVSARAARVAQGTMLGLTEDQFVIIQ